MTELTKDQLLRVNHFVKELTHGWVCAEAAQGDAHAQYDVGQAHHNWAYMCIESDFPADEGKEFNEAVRNEMLSEAVRWWRKAAEQGHAKAQHELGEAYEWGFGVAMDKCEAVRWYRKSAKQGHANAQIELGNAYEHGSGVAVNKREAVRWFRKAADQGDASGQNLLGQAYANGTGVVKNVRTALSWFRKAAAQGNYSAFLELGEAYFSGSGVAKDDRKAVRCYLDASEIMVGCTTFDSNLVNFFRKHADSGNAWSQRHLGAAYFYGEGVVTNARAAVHWYRKAADQGDKCAQFALGASYFLGEGNVEYEYEAYIWWAIAKAGGNDLAKQCFREIKWRRYLTPTEIRSAKKEATQRLEEIDRSVAECKKKIF